MANERLTLLVKSTDPQYLEGSSLLIEAYALYSDTANDNCIAQLKLKNLDSRFVKAISIELIVFDAFGQELNTVTHHYKNLEIGQNKSFGDKEAIFINDNKANNFKVKLNAISYSDGSVYRPSLSNIFEQLPHNQNIEGLDGELLDQYKRDIVEKGYPKATFCKMQLAKGLWQCGCGSWQLANNKCAACGASESVFTSTLDIDTLKKHLEEHKQKATDKKRKEEEERVLRQKQEAEKRQKEAEEQARRDQIEKEKQEKEQERKEKQKRKILIASIISIAIICITCAIVLFFIPKSHYDNGIKLRSSQKWNEAITEFTQAGNFKDSSEQISETRYQEASFLAQSGKYNEAFAIYSQLLKYKDVKSIIENDVNISAARDEKLKPFKTVGNYIKFGTYEQDNNTANGNEEIEWMVLDTDGNHALLLSRYGLDNQMYDASLSSTKSWEQCDLRYWLNGSFFRTAFNSDEQMLILTTTVNNDKDEGNTDWKGNYGSNNTQDKVFLLSFKEAWTYLPNDNNRRCTPTSYASSRAADGRWWLRSPGPSDIQAAVVDKDGSIYSSYYNGGPVYTDGTYYDNNAVRPALWVDLADEYFYTKAE